MHIIGCMNRFKSGCNFKVLFGQLAEFSKSDESRMDESSAQRHYGLEFICKVEDLYSKTFISS